MFCLRASQIVSVVACSVAEAPLRVVSQDRVRVVLHTSPTKHGVAVTEYLLTLWLKPQLKSFPYISAIGTLIPFDYISSPPLLLIMFLLQA